MPGIYRNSRALKKNKKNIKQKIKREFSINHAELSIQV